MRKIGLIKIGAAVAVIGLIFGGVWQSKTVLSQAPLIPDAYRAFLPVAVKDGPPLKTVVLFATPKIIDDFSDPRPSIERFLDHYRPFYENQPAELIVIFAVGNSEHILQYKGKHAWDEPVAWAALIDESDPYSIQSLTYQHIFEIGRIFKEEAAKRSIPFKIFDQIDQAYEFTRTNFKTNRHPEAMAPEEPWGKYAGYEIMNELEADNFVYATQPNGIPSGKNAGDFLVEQVAAYVSDFEFDGILYGNQLGTRGHWLPTNGPGYSDVEAEAIRHFFEYSKTMLGDRELMWFDSYNNLEIERNQYSVHPDAYQYIDYLMASGFCVITTSERYEDNLRSKLTLPGPTRILATLDYVDPWYSYNSMTDFADESDHLEKVAIANFEEIDGLVMFANDEWGELIPAEIVAGFAARFWPSDD